MPVASCAQIKAPFVPKITGDMDVANFDPMFTTEVARLTPPDQAEAHPEVRVLVDV